MITKQEAYEIFSKCIFGAYDYFTMVSENVKPEEKIGYIIGALDMLETIIEKVGEENDT